MTKSYEWDSRACGFWVALDISLNHFYGGAKYSALWNQKCYGCKTNGSRRSLNHHDLWLPCKYWPLHQSFDAKNVKTENTRAKWDKMSTKVSSLKTDFLPLWSEQAQVCLRAFLFAKTLPDAGSSQSDTGCFCLSASIWLTNWLQSSLLWSALETCRAKTSKNKENFCYKKQSFTSQPSHWRQRRLTLAASNVAE